jgi:hypothetical protein
VCIFCQTTFTCALAMCQIAFLWRDRHILLSLSLRQKPTTRSAGSERWHRIQYIQKSVEEMHLLRQGTEEGDAPQSQSISMMSRSACLTYILGEINTIFSRAFFVCGRSLEGEPKRDADCSKNFFLSGQDFVLSASSF